MRKYKLIINSRTSGKFTREIIDGRSHLVTQMMPVRGDTSMNNVFYPDKDIEASFMQLNMLPAPSGHPVVNGINVLASHPVANNKQNIGGYLRNPRKKGKRVFVDFMLDEQTANNSADGKETIRRIENGEKIGVSTGLGIQRVINKTGSDDFGVKYNREGSGFTFDHVAILLNEEAAGKHAGTELITNSEECEIMLYNAEESDTSNLDAVTELLAGDADYNIKLENGFINVNHSKQTKEEEVRNMDKSKLVLAIIRNSANKFTINDNDRLNAMSEDDLNSIVATNSLDEETAKDFLATNSKIDFAGYAEFKTNKAEFDLFQANKAAEEKVIIDNIIANSSFTAEMLTGKPAAELEAINALLKPKGAVRIGEQSQTQQTNSAKHAVDWS